MGSSVATGVRSLKGQASLTPPGGVPRKSLKGARSSAHSALQQEPLKARLGLPPGAWEGKCSPLAGVAARWGPPGAAPRSPGSGLGCGWRADPKFSKGLAGQLERRSAKPGMARVAADRGRLGAAFPGGASGKDTREQRTPEPRPRAPRTWRALAAVPRAPTCWSCHSAPRLPARAGPFAACSPRSRTRSRRQVALGGRPSPPYPAAPAPRATPPGLSALRPSPSPSPAARYFHTSQCPGPGA